MEVVHLANGDTEVTFHWRAMPDNCEDCGLPAPFISVDAYGPDKHKPLCAICAANAACDGETIRRAHN